MTTLKSALANKIPPLQVGGEKKILEPSFAVLVFIFPHSVYLIVDVQGSVYVCFYQMVWIVCRPVYYVLQITSVPQTIGEKHWSNTFIRRFFDITATKGKHHCQ